MRTLLAKTTTATLVIGGALLVAACGHHDNAATADTNMTNTDTMDSSAGMSNDMSAMDATGNAANSTGDMNAASDMNAAGDMNATPAGNAGNAM